MNRMPKMIGQVVLAKKAEREPMMESDLKHLVKKETNETLTKEDMDSLRLAYLDHMSSRVLKLFPTDLGIIIPQDLPTPTRNLVMIYADFSLPDRIRIIRELSIEGEIIKKELRKRVYFPGSLNNNINTLKSRGAIDVEDQKVKTGKRFRDYYIEFERIESAAGTVREKREAGKMRIPPVSYLMTDKLNWITVTPDSNLSQATSRMVDGKIQAVLVYINDKYKALTRQKALQAYLTKGLSGSTRIADLQEEYFADLLDAEHIESISSLSMRMLSDKTWHALVKKDNLSIGIVSLEDILGVLRDYA